MAEAEERAERVEESREEPQAPQRRVRPQSAQRRGGRSGRRFGRRRRVCAFCVDHVTYIDYKQVDVLSRYISERGQIRPRRKTRLCSKHQRALAVAIKRARHMALLPFTGEHVRLAAKHQSQ
ncbi:MAG: 30S ribosomal protein S18 [Anaerolineae bacterium]|nr:30S ribosomal protein S18 [Anaerolineae bacterium]